VVAEGYGEFTSNTIKNVNTIRTLHTVIATRLLGARGGARRFFMMPNPFKQAPAGASAHAVVHNLGLHGADRPMSEYESALCGMMRLTLDMMIELGADRRQLVKELKSLKDNEQIAGRHTSAAVIDITMRSAGLR